MELRERSNGKAITELKEELSRLREAYSEEVYSLEAKCKKAEDKFSAKEKEWGVKEKFLQDKVALLEAKAQKKEESHFAEVAILKEALAAKMREAENLKEKAVE